MRVSSGVDGDTPLISTFVSFAFHGGDLGRVLAQRFDSSLHGRVIARFEVSCIAADQNSIHVGPPTRSNEASIRLPAMACSDPGKNLPFFLLLALARNANTLAQKPPSPTKTCSSRLPDLRRRIGHPADGMNLGLGSGVIGDPSGPRPLRAQHQTIASQLLIIHVATTSRTRSQNQNGK